jgi:hypothetical protein
MIITKAIRMDLANMSDSPAEENEESLREGLINKFEDYLSEDGEVDENNPFELSEDELYEVVDVEFDYEELVYLDSQLSIGEGVATEDGYGHAKLTLMRIEAELYKSLDLEESDQPDVEITELEDPDELMFIIKARDKSILFFSLMASIIEDITNDLLQETLFTEEYRGTNRSDELIERHFNQEQREQLLLRNGIIDEGLAGELSHIREHRNKLLHNLSDRQLLMGALHSDMTLPRAWDTLSKLEKVYISEIE